MDREINAWSKRKKYPRLRKLCKKAWHITISFIIGIAVATIFHKLTTARAVRDGAEKICEAFSRDEQECKNNIDSALNVADNEMQNTMAPQGGK